MKSPFKQNATKIEPSENCDDDTGMFFPVTKKIFYGPYGTYDLGCKFPN